MKKNPFKKQGAMDTLVNVGIGGAANVAIDYAIEQVEALSSLSDTVVNGIKIAVGVLGGTMTNNKYLGAATRGIATVGAANLVKSLMQDAEETTTTTTTEPAAGLPGGTIGYTLGNRAYRRRNRKVSGLNGGFMGE